MKLVLEAYIGAQHSTREVSTDLCTLLVMLLSVTTTIISNSSFPQQKILSTQRRSGCKISFSAQLTFNKNFDVWVLLG